jgi:hypothetical protein
VYDIAPWGEERKDMRAAMSGLLPWAERGKIQILYPYIPADSQPISDEDETAAIEQLEALRAREEQ